MSFFGFDASLPPATNEQHQEEDLAVYTWGTDDYSNLGQALQEGRDEFNDETFGFSEAVGRAFSGGIDSPEQELTGTGNRQGLRFRQHG
jgi:DNA topoisomerase 2-associated protein PAT1